MEMPTKRIKAIFINYAAALALLFIGYQFFNYQPYYKEFFSGSHNLILFTISTKEVFYYYILLNVIVLPFFYLTLPNNHQTKSVLFWRAIINLPKRKPDENEKVAILGTLVKVFFIPLVLLWFFDHTVNTLWNFVDFIEFGEFFPKGYWLLFHFIFLVDVAFFLIGYTIEHPKLKNEIRSVEPTLLGWFVALACYPPFNNAVTEMIGWYSSDYPQIHDPTWQMTFGIAILFLLSIYAWASVALNVKASNLTNRGIVSKGPYAYVRHPAYVAKNLAWWIGSMPILYAMWFEKTAFEFLLAIVSVLGWTSIYYMRAITEENHLNRDPEYQSYCKKVKYKFIPKVY